MYDRNLVIEILCQIDDALEKIKQRMDRQKEKKYAGTKHKS